MFRQLFTLGLVSLIAAVPTVALASAETPRPDENGDYDYIAQAFVWKVKDLPNGLNCRSGHCSYHSVVEVRSANDFLYLASTHFVGGGRPYINLDESGLPWLKVNGGYETYCFVRANTEFIEPTPYRE